MAGQSQTSFKMKVHSLKHKQDALFTIMDLGGLIHSQEDLGKVLHFLVEKVAQLMKTDACSLFLYDPRTAELTLKATSGLNRELVDKLTIRSGQGLTGKTIELLKPISVADAKKSHRYLKVTDLGEEEFSSYLSVPLVYNGQPIGVMSVQNRKATRFQKRDVDFLLTLSLPAVSLIEKAKFMGTVSSITQARIRDQITKGETKYPPEALKDHILKGIPAVPGIAMGQLKLVKNQSAGRHEMQTQKDINGEIQRLKDAFKNVSHEIRETKKKAEAKFGPDEASIFEAYLLFLESTNFKQQIIGEIKKGKMAVDALNETVGRYMDRMSLARDEYIKERAYDIQDIARKISDYLLYGASSRRRKFQADDETVFCNEFWSISDFVNLDLKKTRGIISPNGGASSHIAILADTLNLPSVLGLGAAASQLTDGDYVIVDGFAGTVTVNPSQSTIELYKEELHKFEKQKQIFEVKKDRRVKLGEKKKHYFAIGANLGMVAHVESALEAGADMVGLYRTEFPFLVRQYLPTEEEQYSIYKRVLELMKGREVVFRTLDIGGDKYVSYLNLPREANPSLGWRAIRFSLERKDLFRIQLRSLLRASKHGKMSILIPMISTVEQIQEVKETLKSVHKELADENVKVARNIPLGIMIEVPSAVEIADKLAREVDFFSLGTNDLIQYALAVDRTNPLVANLYDPFHPAVLKLIDRCIKEAHKAGITVTVCGDMASHALLAAPIIGLGVDGLSMIPRAIPRIKYLARHLNVSSASKLAKKCLRLASGNQVREEIERYFEKHGLTEFTSGDRPVLDEASRSRQ